MALLGRWQLHVSNAKGFDLQNFSYVIQWWAFSAFALGFWARLVRDALRKAPAGTSTSGELVLSPGKGVGEQGYVGPATLQTRTDDGAPVVYRGYRIPDSSTTLVRSHGDPVHDWYNDQLWQLAMADGAMDVQVSGEPPGGPSLGSDGSAGSAEDRAAPNEPRELD